MKKTFEQIAFWKAIDIGFQSTMFVIMLFIMGYSEMSIITLFGLYIMAAAQLLSGIIWTLVLTKDIPRIKSGVNMRRLLIIVAIIIGLSFVDGLVFVALSISMVAIGPVIGICYFIQTIKEWHYYSNARKPYYLL